MKRFLLSFSLLLCWIIAFCQQANENRIMVQAGILSAGSLVKGIYLNLAEFQQNNPSVRTVFRSVEKNLPDNNIYNNMDVSRLRTIGPDGVPVPFIRDHWGLCDGKKVFINFRGKYFQVSLDGKYSSFTASLRANSGMSTFGVEYLLDVVTGRITKISKVYGYRNKIYANEISRILSNEDPALYREFMADENRKMMAYTYIKKLNDSFGYK